jgi:hypothetical protein
VGRARVVVCVRGGAEYLYYGAVVVVPAAVAPLAPPWYVGLVTWGALRGHPPRPPLLPRGPSTVHRAGLCSVGGVGLMPHAHPGPIMVELGEAVE